MNPTPRPPPPAGGAEDQTMLTMCNQDGCSTPAAFLFTWPGQDQKGICAEHAPKLRAVAAAMGMPLQLIPFPDEVQAWDVDAAD